MAGHGKASHLVNLSIVIHDIREPTVYRIFETQHGLTGPLKEYLLDGYSLTLDNLLRNRVSNSWVCLIHLQTMGFSGSRSAVKQYIASRKNLIPVKRQQIAS